MIHFEGLEGFDAVNRGDGVEATEAEQSRQNVAGVLGVIDHQNLLHDVSPPIVTRRQRGEIGR